MIQLRVMIEIPPAARPGFVVTLRDMMQKSQAERGCLYYCFSADLESEARFHLTEEWDSEAAFDAHVKSAHFIDFLALLGKIGATRTTQSRVGELAPYQLRRSRESK